MLSIFPSLLMLQGFGPFLLRIVLGVIFLIWGRKAFRQNNPNMREKQVGGIMFILGVFLVIGYVTQLAALGSVILLGIFLIQKIRSKAFFTDGVNYYFILFIIAISLLLTGPGFLAFDLPL